MWLNILLLHRFNGCIVFHYMDAQYPNLFYQSPAITHYFLFFFPAFSLETEEKNPWYLGAGLVLSAGDVSIISTRCSYVVWYSQLCLDVFLLKINNFTAHQYQRRHLCDCDGYLSEQRQNMYSTLSKIMKMAKCLPKLEKCDCCFFSNFSFSIILALASFPYLGKAYFDSKSHNCLCFLISFNTVQHWVCF